MNADEVNSRVIGCTVRLENSAIECVVLGFTAGEVPELFVRHVNGLTAWVRAQDWQLVAPGANEQVAPAGVHEESVAGRTWAVNRRDGVQVVPRIAYVQKAQV